ncbi:S1/P1 nuclease [Legionella jordanis]|uniref:3'-nucleotidase/nuclease n=1 Tax=Legionella jordanis TaxID=456 RepID=A0A0W0VAM3_9GAMM|nr:S1/P1 nuclease [Legionella jordanis]KTD17160.1 3'-nucleotidase/nuclease [Legionella jordanis]RMX03283.1 nuclease [Legionella jordanis]RMX18261.1 nuclease [Legionella jordanis]VEH12642.1 3'-nucleotidase/nuclease [Legionella jordanis]HAT8713284.1 nuclease [Legionella jordanis]
MKWIFNFVLIAFMFISPSPKSYSWNSLGHRLVGQIAYNHLTPRAKTIYKKYNQALNKVYRPQNMINAAAWLDSLRYRKDLWLQSKHYIDIPFSRDGTELILPEDINAVSAIEDASHFLQKKYGNNFDKGFSLRILLHVVGDIHQPLHAANQFSHNHPKGDQGGNLFPLGDNPVGDNLHSYWDRGGGLLIYNNKVKASELKRQADAIERKWPCDVQNMVVDPKAWALESHQLALMKVYTISPGQKPSTNYQKNASNLTKKQIALAGCRLAALLNRLV